MKTASRLREEKTIHNTLKDAGQAFKELGANRDAARQIQMVEVLDAMNNETAALWREVNELRGKVRKFEAIFERAFQEEAAERLHGGGIKGNINEAEHVGALGKLLMKAGVR